MVGFFQNNNDCPTCEQHIDETFKETMIVKRQGEADKLMKGLKDLEDELVYTQDRLEEMADIAVKIRDKEVHIAKDKSSIDQLERFNKTLIDELNQLADNNVNDEDIKTYRSLKKKMKGIDAQRTNLKEDQTYAEAARNMLQDTGIKTKIIKQYLPIMNKLINTYLTSMEFYVNFTLNENLEETIKSRYRD